MSFHLHETTPEVEALTVKAVIDNAPLLRPEIFELCRWISEYYVSPLGEVLKGALPPGITAKHVETGRFGERLTAAAERPNPSVFRPALTEEQVRRS